MKTQFWTILILLAISISVTNCAAGHFHSNFSADANFHDHVYDYSDANGNISERTRQQIRTMFRARDEAMTEAAMRAEFANIMINDHGTMKPGDPLPTGWKGYFGTRDARPSVLAYLPKKSGGSQEYRDHSEEWPMQFALDR